MGAALINQHRDQTSRRSLSICHINWPTNKTRWATKVTSNHTQPTHVQFEHNYICCANAPLRSIIIIKHAHTHFSNKRCICIWYLCVCVWITLNIMTKGWAASVKSDVRTQTSHTSTQIYDAKCRWDHSCLFFFWYNRPSETILPGCCGCRRFGNQHPKQTRAMSMRLAAYLRRRYSSWFSATRVSRTSVSSIVCVCVCGCVFVWGGQRGWAHKHTHPFTRI